MPLLSMIDSLSGEIRAADRRIEQLARERYPEATRLRQVAGIGPITSLCFVLTLEDPTRFPNSRAVGAYLGMCPRRHDSGARSPQLRITKGPRCQDSCRMECGWGLGPVLPAVSVANRRQDRAAAHQSRFFLRRGRRGYRRCTIPRRSKTRWSRSSPVLEARVRTGSPRKLEYIRARCRVGCARRSTFLGKEPYPPRTIQGEPCLPDALETGVRKKSTPS